MSAPWARLLLGLCFGTLGCINYWLAEMARSGSAPSTVVMGLALAFVPYGGALVLSRSPTNDSVPVWVAPIATLVLGAPFVFSPPVLSDDLYRYLWEGRLWLEGFNPYRFPPEDPSLLQLRDDIWGRINNKAIASIYPPLLQLVFVTAAWLGGQVWTVKLLALLAHAISVAVVAKLCARPGAALALALNPLVLSEGALNGHFDILTGTALLVAAWAIARHRFVAAGLAACGAVGLKVVGLISLPLFVRRPRALIVTGLASGLLLVPIACFRGPLDPKSGAGQFATRWRGNESLFALVDGLTGQLVGENAAGLVARAVVVGAMLVLSVIVVRQRLSPLRAMRVLAWAALLLSPQVHPWYLCWLLPLEVAAGGWAGLVWSATVLCAYAPIDRWVAEGVWEMPIGLQIFEYAAVLLALTLDPRRPSLRNGAPDASFRGDSDAFA